MSGLDIRSARSLSPGERAELFNAAYEGYLIPFHLDERQLASMDDTFDLDLDASRIAYRDGTTVGLGNLGVRGEDAWIGGVGVVPKLPPGTAAIATSAAIEKRTAAPSQKRRRMLTSPRPWPSPCP